MRRGVRREALLLGMAALVVAAFAWVAPTPGSEGGFWQGSRAEAKSRWKRGSEKNQKACKAWCDKHKSDAVRSCIKCSKYVGCGVGFKRIKSFKGRGKNWHACGRNTYGKNSRLNESFCNAWCKKTADCAKCSRRAACGVGYSNMKSFRTYQGLKIVGPLEIPTYPGKTWYACKKRTTYRKATASNKARCEAWCRETSRCHKCSKWPGCGRGYKRLKYPRESFRGQGRNYYPCKKR